MIFNDKFIEEIKLLNGLGSEIYERTLNYTIDTLTKENSALEKFHDVIEMEDEAEAAKILSASTRLIIFIAKNKFNNFMYKTMMEMLLLEKEKKDLINQKLEANADTLRRNLNDIDLDPLPKFKNLEWRYDIQISSRSYDEEIKPRIFLKLGLQRNGKNETLNLETDYANLKNLQEELSNALKVHESAKSKKIRNKFY